MRLLIRWLIAIIALAAAVWIVPGIRVEGSSAIIVFAIMAVILGFVNAFIRPFLTFLSCGFIVLTMGLFLFVVNALAFWLSSWIAVNVFQIGFYVDGFWSALLGSLIVSIVTLLLSVFLPDKHHHQS
jgi:putative membrane protein